MPEEGIEPTRPEGHGILSPAGEMPPRAGECRGLASRAGLRAVNPVVRVAACRPVLPKRVALEVAADGPDDVPGPFHFRRYWLLNFLNASRSLIVASASSVVPWYRTS